MRAAVSVLQAILILVIAVSLVIIALPWAIKNINISIDMTEIGSIKSQFDTCNERILDTARTGSTNRCMFDIRNGEITGREEGIYYSLVSQGQICDPTPLVEIDSRTHVWEECNASGESRAFGMLWMFPKELNISGTGISGSKIQGQSTVGGIDFGSSVNFRTLTLSVEFQYNVGEAGKVVEMSRINITDQNVTLSVKIE